MRVPTVSVPHGRDLADMELQIHCIETEAYSAVLKAFIAQSDVLSWGKEGLITELRKELRVSDVEHREILVHVDSDDSIRMIRESRKSTVAQEGVLSHTTHSAGSIPGSTVHTSGKRLKSGHLSLSSSPKYLPRVQPSLTGIPSSVAAHYRDSQWGDDMATKPTHRNDGRATKSVLFSRHLPVVGKGRGCLKVKSDKRYTISADDYYHKESDSIEIRETDKLIHEVERVCGGQNPDPAQLEKAKIILREHEQALLNALSKLDDASDGDGAPDQSPLMYLSGDFPRTGQARGPHHGGLAQVNRMRSYASKGLEMDHANRTVFPPFDRNGEDGNEGG